MTGTWLEKPDRSLMVQAMSPRDLLSLGELSGSILARSFQLHKTQRKVDKVWSRLLLCLAQKVIQSGSPTSGCLKSLEKLILDLTGVVESVNHIKGCRNPRLCGWLCGCAARCCERVRTCALRGPCIEPRTNEREALAVPFVPSILNKSAKHLQHLTATRLKSTETMCTSSLGALQKQSRQTRWESHSASPRPLKNNLCVQFTEALSKKSAHGSAAVIQATPWGATRHQNHVFLPGVHGLP